MNLNKFCENYPHISISFMVAISGPIGAVIFWDDYDLKHKVGVPLIFLAALSVLFAFFKNTFPIIRNGKEVNAKVIKHEKSGKKHHFELNYSFKGKEFCVKGSLSGKKAIFSGARVKIKVNPTSPEDFIVL
jgi:hypothetical protein